MNNGRCVNHAIRAAVGAGERGFQPFELPRLLGLARAEQHRVEPDEPPVFHVMQPPIGAEVPAPARKPLRVDGLMRVAGFADVVVARHRAQRRLELRASARRRRAGRPRDRRRRR